MSGLILDPSTECSMCLEGFGCHRVGSSTRFTVNWRNFWLRPTDNIAASSWVSAGGIIIGTMGFTADIAWCYVSGGVIGTVYPITNTIQTDDTDGETYILNLTGTA